MEEDRISVQIEPQANPELKKLLDHIEQQNSFIMELMNKMSEIQEDREKERMNYKQKIK